jgi:hypothetical protein
MFCFSASSNTTAASSTAMVVARGLLILSSVTATTNNANPYNLITVTNSKIATSYIEQRKKEIIKNDIHFLFNKEKNTTKRIKFNRSTLCT